MSMKKGEVALVSNIVDGYSIQNEGSFLLAEERGRKGEYEVT